MQKNIVYHTAIRVCCLLLHLVFIIVDFSAFHESSFSDCFKKLSEILINLVSYI